MKKSSLGRRSSRTSVAGRPSSDVSTVRKSGIPLPRQRGASSERQSFSNAGGRLGRALSASNLNMNLMTPSNKTPISSRHLMYSGTSGMGGTERPSRATSFGTSSVGSIGGQKSKRDDRPLQDKEWQAQAFRFVEMTIRENPAGADVLVNGLKPLTITNFLDACNCLFRMLGHRVEITKHNWFKELPFLLNKKMQYKGKVEKSWMMAVSSAQGVPYGLGVLHFLAECAHVVNNEDVQNLMFPPRFDEPQPDLDFQILIPYYNQSYQLRKANKPDAEMWQEELDRAVLQEHFPDDDRMRGPAIEESLEQVHNDFARIQHENHLELEELRSLEAEFKNLSESVTADEEKLVKSKIAESSHHLELEAIEQESRAVASDLAFWKEEHDKISEKMSQAAITLRDIECIKKKRDSIDREITSSRKYINSYQDMIFQEDLEIVSLKTGIEELTRESNLKVMKYVPIDRVFEKLVLPAKINENDLSNFHESAIQKMTSTYESTSSELDRGILAAEQEKEKVHDDLKHAETALDSCLTKFASREAEVTSSMDEFNKARISMEDDMARAAYEVETLTKKEKALSDQKEAVRARLVEKENDAEEARKIFKEGTKDIADQAKKAIQQMAISH